MKVISLNGMTFEQWEPWDAIRDNHSDVHELNNPPSLLKMLFVAAKYGSIACLLIHPPEHCLQQDDEIQAIEELSKEIMFLPSNYSTAFMRKRAKNDKALLKYIKETNGSPMGNSKAKAEHA